MPGLSLMSQSLCHMFSHCFHWESIAMKRTMQSFDEMPPVCMGGKLGMTKSMYVSITLANLAHYDVQDLWVGVAMWMEMDPTQKTDVYFVFPNLVVKDKNECTHYGVLVK